MPRPNPLDGQKRFFCLKFACAHLRCPAFLGRPTAVKPSTNGIPPPSNLLALICAAPPFSAVRLPPNPIQTGFRFPQICLRSFALPRLSRPPDCRQTQYRRDSSPLKFACAHLRCPTFPDRPTAAKPRTDGIPLPSNLLALICTALLFPTVRLPPNPIQTGFRFPQICLRSFALPGFSRPSDCRRTQYRRDSASLKFACAHLRCPAFLGRPTAAKPNADGIPLPSNLLALICAALLFPTVRLPPNPIRTGFRYPQICLLPFEYDHSRFSKNSEHRTMKTSKVSWFLQQNKVVAQEQDPCLQNFIC